MIKNYLKIAFRNIIQYRGYTFLNVVGLGIGMACFILISLWVRDELSFDQFHEKKNRIHRVLTKTDTDNYNTNSSWKLGPAFKEKYPEIEEFCRIRFRESSPIRYKDKLFVEDNFFLADPSIFTMFTFPFKEGEPQTALAYLNSIVITEATAKRYFGEDNPIGKVLHVLRYQSDFIVTGIVEDIPSNSHIQFDMVARVEWMGEQRLNSWEFTGFTYVTLHPKVSPGEMNQKLKRFYIEEVNPEFTAVPELQPITKVHLYQLGKPGIIKQVYTFSIIAVFTLLIACINFINLSTAKSSKRAKEVGIRKVSGATRLKLVKQFLGESLLLAFISIAMAVVLVELILPFFNDFTMKELSFTKSITLSTLVFLVGIVLFAGVFSGAYPALFLASFQPVSVLKGQTKSSNKSSSIRKLLIIFQFAVSIGLIICTVVFHKQLNFIQEKDLGYDKNQIMTIPVPNDPGLKEQYVPFKNELLKLPGIVGVTSSASRPTQVNEWIEINWEGNTSDNFIPVNYTMVDYDFFETFDLELVKGRSFSKEFVSDETEACIINESASASMELDSPIGAKVYFNHPAFDESFKQVRIIGVVEDFHFRSLHDEIGPFIFRVYRPWHSFIFVKIKPQNIQETVQNIASITNTIAPGYEFRFEFLDEAYNRLYLFETKIAQLVRVFSVIAIIISCLGLYGLVSYTAERKTKEIGVRKVLGASVPGIVFSLSKDFTKWVFVANLIAWPVAWFSMNGWLQEFAYKIDLSWWVFVMSGGIALFIALATVSFQSIKAAIANPVDALRYE